MKELHACWCSCHSAAGRVLSQARENEPLGPMALRWVLPMSRHVCGPHCTEADPDSPVRLGGWGAPERFDRAPVRLSCGHVVAPGYAHSCGPRPGKPVLFGGWG